MLKPLVSLCASLFIATPVLSKPLNIVTDIAPIYSLVSQVKGGTENVTLLLDTGASPHSFALKPSQAKALQNADLVIFAGLSLTPWLEKPLDTLAKKSSRLSLLDSNETVLYEMRKNNVFDDDHHDHSHDRTDPHGWMDPQNARVWLSHIANELSAHDPENAVIYKRNSQQAQAKLLTLEEKIAQQLSVHATENVIFFHDAYQYFEQRFHVSAVGAVTLADDAEVTPKQLRAIEGLFEGNNIRCVLIENTTKSDWVNNLAGRNVPQTALDPLGAAIPLDENLYSTLIQTTADQITNCLKAT